MTISFWVILLAVLVYGLLHTLLASLKLKALARSWFGLKSDRWLRLAYNFIAVVTLLPILFLPVLLIDKELYRIRFPWVIITLIIQGIALLVVLIGLRQTGIKSFIGVRQLFLPEDTTPPRLVTHGLYRYVRHPLYTAGLVFIWLFPIMTCNLLALNLGLTAYILVGAYFEERKLLGEFGMAYASYRQRTPMLIPGLRLKRPDQ
ncbi:MAG: methyltransferase family protein [Acidobacteriaceae bacterium]